MNSGEVANGKDGGQSKTKDNVEKWFLVKGCIGVLHHFRALFNGVWVDHWKDVEPAEDGVEDVPKKDGPVLGMTLTKTNWVQRDWKLAKTKNFKIFSLLQLSIKNSYP